MKERRREVIAVAAPGRHQGVYVIGVVKHLTGLSERQIRYYEEAGLVQPQRSAGNQRLYSPVDVERLLQIKLLIGRGFNLEEVRRCLEERDAGDERWIEYLRGQMWDKTLYERVQRLRDLAPIRVLADYRRHHPPSIDRLYRGGMGSTVATLRAQPIRLYPPSDPVLLGVLYRRAPEAGREGEGHDR